MYGLAAFSRSDSVITSSFTTATMRSTSCLWPAWGAAAALRQKTNAELRAADIFTETSGATALFDRSDQLFVAHDAHLAAQAFHVRRLRVSHHVLADSLKELRARVLVRERHLVLGLDQL